MARGSGFEVASAVVEDWSVGVSENWGYWDILLLGVVAGRSEIHGVGFPDD
jgi:hypothetical protein